ncbi:MAG: hypothetical protein QM800_10915 [Paludibacter sp.]
MTKKNFITLALLMIGSLSFYSCQDELYNHYERSAALPDKNLYDLIKQNDQLSKFAKLVQVAGYDTILASTQSLHRLGSVKRRIITY